MRRSIRANYFYNLTYQILVIITPLITTPYVSRVLGADGIGTYSYTESVASYFVIFATMGITTFGQREVSYYQDDRYKRSNSFWNTKILSWISCSIILSIYLLYLIITGKGLIYYVFVFNILAVAFDVTWLFQGMEDFRKIVIRNIIFKVLNIAFIFLFIKKYEHLILYTFGICFFHAVSFISLWPYVFKYVDRINLSEIRPFKDYRVVLSLFIPTIAIQIYTVLDKTMIGVITQDPFQNGYYDQAIKMSRLVLTIITSLGTVMIPRIGFLFNKTDQEGVSTLMYKGYRFVWFLGIPLTLGLSLVSSHFVPWFYGPGYDDVVPLLGVLSLLIIAIGINNLTGIQYLIPTKRQNLFTLSVLLGALLNFTMNMALIPLYGALGAAIASVMAESAIALIQLYMIRKEISFLTVIKNGAHYYIAGFFMACILLIVKRSLAPSIVSTILLVLTGMIAYFAILLLMKDSFFLNNAATILKKIKSIVRR